MDSEVYTKKINTTSLTSDQIDALDDIAYHLQEARMHLDQVSTTKIARVRGITRQAQQKRINKRRAK